MCCSAENVIRVYIAPRARRQNDDSKEIEAVRKARFSAPLKAIVGKYLSL